ncbi:MAG: hypothetical protein HUJ25_08600 [Crocinitomicaceae bacterium]|nr:hypothetical protein [Crocinitomicaceae bacterium]
MEEILIYSGVYGILVMAFMNAVVVFISYRRKRISLLDGVWLLLFIIGVSLLAGAVFFRNITKMHQWYYPLIFASLIGLIGLFLRLTRQLLRRR